MRKQTPQARVLLCRSFQFVHGHRIKYTLYYTTLHTTYRLRNARIASTPYDEHLVAGAYYLVWVKLNVEAGFAKDTRKQPNHLHCKHLLPQIIACHRVVGLHMTEHILKFRYLI
jgi:hypothetical protein